MNPHRLAYGFAYSFPFAAVIAAVTIVSLLFSKEDKKIIWTPLTIILSLFILWTCISTLFSFSPTDAQEGLTKFLKIQLAIFITIMVFKSRERINQLIWVIVASIGYYGVKGGVFTLATGGQFSVFGPSGSEISGNNEIALALLMILPFQWYLRTQSENKWIRHALLASILLCAFSIISSYSRGAFVAAAAVAIIFWMKSNKKIMIGAVVAVIAISVLSFMPAKYFNRINTIQTYEQDASAMGRINAWTFAFNLAADRPLTGGGFGAFDPSLFLIYAPDPLDFHDAHSIYFEVLGEQGFVGLFLFLALWLLCYRTFGNIRKKVRNIESMRWADSLSAMSQVSLVAYGVGGAFLGLAYFDLPYHTIAICILCQAIVNKELEHKQLPRKDVHTMQSGYRS